MDLTQLSAFVAVAESGGFSRAAAKLVSTQPTLSRQVKALEQELGRPLFDRLGRRVELTAFGRESLDRARAILAKAEDLIASARVEPGQATGSLSVAVADSVVLKRFPRIVQRFQRRHPAVRVHVHTASSPDILNGLREGRYDAGLCMLPRIHPELRLSPLWDDHFVGAVPPEHPFANKAKSLEEFAAERMLAIEPGTMSHQVLTSAFHAAGLSMVPDMTFDNFQMIVDLIRAGVGVGIVSKHVAVTALRRNQIGRVRIKEIDKLRRVLGLAIHAERELAGALAAFVELAEQQVELGSPA